MTKSKKPSVRGLVAPLLAIAALLVLIWGVRVLSAVNRLQADARALTSVNPEELLAAPSPETDARLAEIAQDLQDLRMSAGPVIRVLPALGWVPRYGGDLASAPALLDLADSTVHAALDTLSVGRALMNEMQAGRAEQVPAGVLLLNTVQSQSALIERAQQGLRSASRTRQGISAASLSSTPRGLLNRFDRWFPTWQTGVEVLANAPSILGADRPRTYLLIAQNSDELRPTGGFVSAVALVRVDHGNITTTGFEDSFAVDDLTKAHPDAPPPLFRYMYAWEWMFRDANWSPDIPTSARQLMQVYAMDRGIATDGVIAINVQAVPALLPAFGALTLPNETSPVSAENVAFKIQENWTSPQIAQGQAPDWWAHRKDFLGGLFQVALGRLLSGDFDQTRLLSGLSAAATRQDLWAFLEADAGLPALLFPVESGLNKRPGDALMLVDSNVGFNKVDSHVSRRMEYSVTLDPTGAARSSVTIRYTNTSSDNGTFCVHLPLYSTSYAELQEGCYWDYIRVLAPENSRLVSSSGVADASQADSEPGASVLGGYLILPTGKTQEVGFTYDQPDAVQTGMVYSLHLDKQPGAPDIPATVRLTWPAQWEVQSSSPAPEHQTAEGLEFAVLLDRDQTISIAFAEKGSLLTPAAQLGGLVAAAFGVAAYRFLRLNGN